MLSTIYLLFFFHHMVLITLVGLDISFFFCFCQVYIFWYKSTLLRNDIMPSILALSKSSLMLFILKKVFLNGARAVHSVNTCFIVYADLQVWHVGCFSSFSRYECVILVWPMCKQTNTTSSFWDFLYPGFHLPSIGLICSNLFGTLSLQHCCYFYLINLFIMYFRPV